MPTIKSTGWTGNTTTWYFSFEYNIAVQGLTATIDWDLYIRTKDKVATTKFVYAEYDLIINDTTISNIDWYFEAKRDKYLDSGSFTINLDKAEGKGDFTIQLKGSFYESGSNNNSIAKQKIAVNGGWSILENCKLDSQKTKDNGNNTAQIVFTLPSNNLSNIVEGAKLLWTTNNLIPTEGTAYTFTKIYQGKELTVIEDTLPFDSRCKSIQFQLIPIGSQDSASSVPPLTNSIQVLYYGSPYFTTPIDDELIYKNQKPTINETLVWKWSAANEFNSNSPVKGYVLDIFKNNEPMVNFYPELMHNEWTFNAGSEPLNFRRQDNIYLGIRAYTINGQGNRLYSEFVFTQDYTFGNNGISHFKIDDNWKIGQVWLKDNNEWKIASALFLKDEDNQWHIAI